MKVITPLGYHDTAVYFRQLGVPEEKDVILKCMGDRMVDAYTHRVPAKNNVIAVLQELKNRGCSLNVLTASPHLTMDPCLKRLGIYDWFDHVWSCEDFGLNKANPEIYHRVAEKLDVPVKDVLFLDDNPNADRAARQAGMKVCGVYDDFTAEFAEEMKQENAYYIRDFDELPTISYQNSTMQMHGAVSVSKKLACGDLFRQNRFSLHLRCGCENLQGNLATQGF